jgi:hypothetical protein
MSEGIVDDNRGTGRTTRQMEAAPRAAVYIWVNSRLDYPKQLARDIGRDDLIIVSPSWLDSERFRGTALSGVVLDHAALLTYRQRMILGEIVPTYIRRTRC